MVYNTSRRDQVELYQQELELSQEQAMFGHLFIVEAIQED